MAFQSASPSRPIRTALPVNRLLLLGILLLAFFLRIYRLDTVPLRGDESLIVLLAQRPIQQMWNAILYSEPHPPMMYLILRGLIAVAGSGEFAVRYFSLFWGVLSVPLCYRLVRVLLRGSSIQWAERAALIAAFLFAINPFQIWYSQDVHNYTLWPALDLLALGLFWQWTEAELRAESGAHGAPSKSRLVYLALFTMAELAALFTHYYETFVLLALNLFVFAHAWRRRGMLLRWIGAQAVLAVTYLPYPLFLSNRVLAYQGNAQQGTALWTIWQQTFSTLVLGETLDVAVRNLAWIPFALAAVAVFLWLLRRDRRLALFLLLYAGVPVVAVFLVSFARPVYRERYLNVIAPAYYILFALGIAALLRPALSRGTALVLQAAALVFFAGFSLLALTNYYYNPAYAKAPDWRSLASVILNGRQEGDVIVENFSDPSLNYYVHDSLPIVIYPKNSRAGPGTGAALDDLGRKYNRIWFLPASGDWWDPDHFVRTWLDGHDQLVGQTTVATFEVRLYTTPKGSGGAQK